MQVTGSEEPSLGPSKLGWPALKARSLQRTGFHSRPLASLLPSRLLLTRAS